MFIKSAGPTFTYLKLNVKMIWWTRNLDTNPMKRKRRLMSNFERKFGKYAIPNLTILLIGCYVIGYLMQLINTDFIDFLTLDVYKIVTRGQVWRIISWILVPPESFDIFTIIMLFFYYSIGTTMERTMGYYKYNVFIFRGIALTVVGAFACFGFCYLLYGGVLSEGSPQIVQMIFEQTAYLFSTYYINMSIFLAFAIVYPNMQVLLMFVIPVKVKWMGIIYVAFLLYSFYVGPLFTKFAIGASLVNVLIFFLMVRNLSHLRPKEIKRRAEFHQKVQKVRSVTKHKCAICGQTEEDNPDLEFRFCSKCNGNYEYCSEHLYTHEHVR